LTQPAQELSRNSAQAREKADAQLTEIDLRGVDGGRPQHRQASVSLSLRRYIACLVLADLLVAGLSATLAVFLRFNGSHASVNGIPYVTLLPLLPTAWLTAMWLGGSYEERVLVCGSEEFRRVLNASVWLLAAISVGAFVLHVPVSRTVTAIALFSATTLSLANRYVARRVLQTWLRGDATLHRAVVVGSVEEAACLSSHMVRNSHVGFSVTAVHTPHRASPGSVSQRIGRILEEVDRTGADTVAVASTSGLTSSQLHKLAWSLEGTGVRLMVVPALTDLAGPRIRVRPIDGLPLLHVEEPEFIGPRVVLKRCIDIVGGTLITLLLLPILLLISLTVLVGSGRPVVYSQVRVGRHGKHFRMYKFRTMIADADQVQERIEEPGASPVRAKPSDDPRVTNVGSFLRRHSLDELPQLWNVFGGSMSLVGPRPHRPVEVARYGQDARRRLLIKPGLTGLWQVSGRAALPWDEAVRLDLRYVENWSVWSDGLLLLKTLRAVLFPNGAY
jgi:exopolysaccharide biosynthesis polyprenyl glycosylphosphotransferase